MKKTFAAGITALALAVPVSTVVAAPAHAGGIKFSNCDALTKKFRNGVAANKAAANRQVRAGNKRPAYGKQARQTYTINRANLDRDKDGTACEQS